MPRKPKPKTPREEANIAIAKLLRELRAKEITEDEYYKRRLPYLHILETGVMYDQETGR